MVISSSINISGNKDKDNQIIVFTDIDNSKGSNDKIKYKNNIINNDYI